MAETVDILNARVVVDASSVQQARTQFNSAMDEMTAKTKQVGATTTEMGNQVKRASEQSVSSLQAFRRTWFDVIAVMGAFTMAGMAVVKAFQELQKAAEFRGMVMATRSMAGEFGVDMQKVLDALDKASNGTLTAREKFRLLNEAMLAGGAEVAEELPRLVEIARAAATASGVEFEVVFQKLLLGIARGSAKLIDDARIYLRVGDVVEQYAKAHGLAADEIDAHTKMMIVLGAVLEDGDRVIRAVGEDAVKEADAFKKLNKELETTPQVISQLGEAIGIVEGLATAFGALNQVIAMFGQAAVGYGGMIVAIDQFRRGKISATEFTAALKQASAAADETFRRMVAPMGIVSPVSGDIEAARQRAFIKNQQQMAQQTADAEKLEADRLERLKTFRDKEADLVISAGEKVIDARENMLQDMEELEIDHQQKLEDIALDGIRKRQEIEINYGRKIEDAGLEYQRAIEDQQRESDNRRIEIEQRYQERLRQIQRRFQDAYWEAVKTRDAVALVEAVRDRNRGIEDATRQRDIDLENEARNREESRNNAWLNYQRKLQDAERYYRDAMYDQQLAEQRAIEDEMRNHQYREAEISRHYQWRLQEIDRWLNAEIQQARDKYAQMQADASAHYAAMAAIVQAALGYGGGNVTSPTMGRVRRRQQGGVDLVNSPTPFLAGEGGPELVLTVPLGGGQQMLPAPMSHLVSGDVRHQVDMISASGMRGMEARIIAATMQALREVYRR